MGKDRSDDRECAEGERLMLVVGVRIASVESGVEHTLDAGSDAPYGWCFAPLDALVLRAEMEPRREEARSLLDQR